jgi:broad specificity phosphatase PhoE
MPTSSPIPFDPADFGPRALFLARHAERDGDTDALSPRGIGQASQLARLLANAGITTIYCTQYRRTQETAAKVLELQKERGVSVGLKIIPVSGSPPNASQLRDHVGNLVDKMRSQSGGKIVLIIGHDATVPAIIEAVGRLPAVTIPSTEYTNLFLVITSSRPGLAPGLIHIPDYTSAAR